MTKTPSQNAVDKLIGVVHPSEALKRQKARMALHQLRRFDGAGGGRRTDGWTSATSSSADAVNGPDLAKMRDRSRDLTRNSPYASRAVSTICSNTVGTGILPRISSRRSKVRQSRITDLFNEWATDPSQIDWESRNDFYGLQNLVLRTVVESGECLIRRRTVLDNETIPLRLQILEPDFLDTGRDGAIATGHIKQGIEFNREGQRVAYWVFETHPGDSSISSISGLGKSNRIDAKEILHVYRQERPGASRGIPWSHSVIIKLRDFEDYSDAQLLKQKISACFAGFVVEPESPDAALEGHLIESLEPGLLEVLPPGKDIKFANPPSTAEYEKFTRSILLQIASGYGITYESLTSDLSATNFSSARLGWLEFYRNIETWRWQMLIPQFLTPTWKWFKNAAEIGGVPVGDVKIEWTPPRRELIDPSTEIEATIKQVRAGLLSLPKALRQFGYDPEEIMAEIGESNDRLDALKLILDSDPRQTAHNGATQKAESSEDSSTEESQIN